MHLIRKTVLLDVQVHVFDVRPKNKVTRVIKYVGV